MNLKDKTVLITGASQGLGEQVAYKVAREGANTLLLARNSNLLDKVKTNILTHGGSAETVVCDIRDLEQVDLTMNTILSKFDNIDILINNAGVWTDNNLERENPELRANALMTNILGHIHVSETLLPSFQSANKGTILNVISTSGVSDIPSGSNALWRTYGASKHGMRGYSSALRESLRDTKIKVIEYYPGGFESNLYANANRPNPHNQPWMMKTEDVADIILFALTRPNDVYMEKIVVSKG